MARLASLNKITSDGMLDWYVSNVYWSGGNPKAKFPNKEFPHILAYSIGNPYKDPHLDKVAMRIFIEEELTSTVLYQYHDYGYWCENGKRNYDSYRTGEHVENTWYVFYFQNEPERMLFSLKFPHGFQAPTWAHPSGEYPRAYEETEEFKERWKL